jgi:hypothetical protein
VAIFSNELAAKRLDLLHELVPHSKSIAVLINSDFGPSARFRADVEAAARALGLATPILQASTASEIETVFNSLAQTRPDALLVGPGPFLDSHRDLLVARAAKIAIPAAYETRASALAGGLVSYGADVYRRHFSPFPKHCFRSNAPADSLEATPHCEVRISPWLASWGSTSRSGQVQSRYSSLRRSRSRNLRSRRTL